MWRGEPNIRGSRPGRGQSATLRREGALRVVDSLEIPEAKTRLVDQKLRELGLEDALFVTASRDRRLELAGRNIPKVRVLEVAGLNVRDVVARKVLVLTKDAVDALVERLQ